MDPFSIVISLAICIKSRLDNIKEKNSTIVALSANVNRICATLEPFKDVAERESTIKDSLLGLGDALARTKEHLLVWGSKKRSNTLNSFTEFFNSSDIIKMLKDDERQLSLQIMLLSLSFTASSYVRDGLPVISQSEKDTFISVSIRNQDLLEFWREYVDSKAYSIPNHTLCQALNHWFGPDLSEQTLKNLIFRLDEFMTGEVTLANLDEFSGNTGLRNMIQMFEDARTSVRELSPWIPSFLPLIVWVDDNPANNDLEVQFAQMLNVTVIQLQSTALAKNWIEEHEDILRGNDIASRIRFISDNTRFETGPRHDSHAGSFLNISAGENILRYLRGRLYSLPVLIYAGRSISTTQYVLSYENAGSTSSRDVVKDYIMALAGGQDTDMGWKMFMA